MCTVVLRIAPAEPFPLILAANRDERVDRAWDPPSAWWPDRPDVIGGRDSTAGGTWMALNQAGVVACVLNRPGSLGPAPGKRSRGLLPLLALEQKSASAASAAIQAIPAEDFRSFNLVLGDTETAICLRSEGTGPITPIPLEPGVHMITARDPDDTQSPRVARALPRFRAAPPPDPAQAEWASWETILADRSGPPGSEINVPERAGFGTVCASLLALPRHGKPIWLFAAGPPDRAPFVPLGPEFQGRPGGRAPSVFLRTSRR